MTALRFTGPVKLAGKQLTCPGGRKPRRLTLHARGEHTMATCGDRHPAPGQRGKASCWWTVEALPPAVIEAIAAQVRPGQISLTLADGTVLRGKLAAVKQNAKAPTEKKPRRNGLFAVRPTPAKKTAAKTPARRGGTGTAAAAFGAVTALAQAVGQTAGAAASITNSVTGLAKETVATTRTGITALNDTANRTAAARFARRNIPGGDS